jgi:hypothetical protein
MKTSVVLLEVIFSSIIVGVLFFTSIYLAKALAQKNNLAYASNIAKLDLESTREFLSSKIKINSKLNNSFDIFDKLKYDKITKELLYNNNLLLHNVVKFEIISKYPQFVSFKICIKPVRVIVKKDFNICQTQVLLKY